MRALCLLGLLLPSCWPFAAAQITQTAPGEARVGSLVDAAARTPMNAPSDTPMNISLPPYSAGRGGDDTAALNRAAGAAALSGKALYLPCGTYRHSGTITLPGVTLTGDGACSTLLATPQRRSEPTSAILLTGQGPSLSNVTVDTTYTGPRATRNILAGAIVVSGANGFTVDHAIIHHAASVGVDITGNSSHGSVTHNVSIGSLADSFYITSGSSFITETHNQADNAGDDCFSVVGYVNDTGVPHHITEADNTCDTGAARGFSVVGGHDVSITGGSLHNIAGAGLYINSEDSYNTGASYNISIDGVSVDGAGAVDRQASVFISGRAGFVTKNITISHLVATNLRYRGIELGPGDAADEVVHVIIDHNQLSGAATRTTDVCINLMGVSDVDVDHNLCTHWGTHGLVALGALNRGTATLESNSFSDLATSGIKTAAVMYFYDSQFSNIAATNNSYRNGRHPVQSFLNATGGDILGSIGGNTGDVTINFLGKH